MFGLGAQLFRRFHPYHLSFLGSADSVTHGFGHSLRMSGHKNRCAIFA